MIEQDLGYCCVWFFFTHYRRTGVVADRLGVDPSSIRATKRQLRNTREGCQNRPNCLHCKVTLAGKLRRQPDSAG